MSEDRWDLNSFHILWGTVCVRFVCLEGTEVELPVTKYSLQIFTSNGTQDLMYSLVFYKFIWNMFIMIRVWAGHLRVLGLFHCRGRDFLFSTLLMLKILDFQMLRCVMSNLNCMLHSVTSQKTRILRFSFHQCVHTASATEPTLGAVGTEGSFPRKWSAQVPRLTICAAVSPLLPYAFHVLVLNLTW